MGDRRGTRPKKRQASALPAATKPPDYNDRTPRFCLNFMQPGYAVKDLPANLRAEFAMALATRSQMTWNQITLADRHGLGTEWIAANAIKPTIPEAFQDNNRFLSLRYAGKLPMVGARTTDTFHVLWIEKAFGAVYDH
jgi:hypothetical protein